jgi:HK97 family phage portal protein
MSAVFDLTARRHESATLARFIAGRAGAAERAGWGAGVQAAGENAVTTNLTAEQLMAVLGIASASAAGVAVTPETAMRVATVYGCVSLIAGAIATLPIGIFERNGDERQRVSHDYWWMLNEQANDDMTSAAAWEYMIAAKLFYGDGFAQLLRPGYASSRVIGWRPLHPQRVQPFADTDGTLYYRVSPANGATYVLDAADMVQLPSLGFDGFTSPSPITYAARESIGTSLAAEAYSGKFFSEGATFDYALKTASHLKKEQLDDLKTSLLARVQNGGTKRSPLILTGGLEPAQLSVNPRDAEVLATRIFSVEEICRIFGVPPHMVGHTDKTTSWGAGIEQQGIGFVRYTLQRHLTPIAQEFNRKLWPVRARYFVEHITAALERGDLKARYEAYRVALGRAGEQPFLATDEIRRFENMPPNADLKVNPGAAAPTPP